MDQRPLRRGGKVDGKINKVKRREVGGPLDAFYDTESEPLPCQYPRHLFLKKTTLREQ